MVIKKYFRGVVMMLIIDWLLLSLGLDIDHCMFCIILLMVDQVAAAAAPSVVSVIHILIISTGVCR